MQIMEKLRIIPAFKSAVMIGVGILLGSKFYVPMYISIPLLLVLLLAGIFFHYKSNFQNVTITFTFIILLAFGFIRANYSFYHLPDESIANIPDTRYRASYELIGIVSELPYYDSSRVRFVLSSEMIVTRKDTINVTGDVMVNMRKNLYKPDEKPPELKPGDRISMIGRLSEAFEERNPGEFDYRRYLRLHDVYKIFYISGYDKTILLSRNNLGFFKQKILYPAKEYALNNIDEHLSGDRAAYLKGLVTGERSDISREMREAFINTGVMHLIAVSGLNVAYIIITITLLLTLFRVPYKYRIYVMIPVLIFYCLFTGAPASIVRATIMGILFLISISIQRKTNFFNIVGISALIILMYDPKQLFDPGFVLSYSAVISMVFFYNRFEQLLKNKIEELQRSGKQYIRIILVMFLTTLAAQIGTLPITAMYFGKISIISLFANLIVVPFANLALAIGFFQILAGIFSNYLSSVIAETNNILLSAQLGFIEWCASFEFAYVDFFGFNIYNIVIYFVCLILLITAVRNNIAFRIALCLLLVISVPLVNLNFKDETKITIIDVGHGNCTLIQTSEGKNILIDAGIRTRTFNSSERTIIPFLKRNGIGKIDLFIISNDKNSQGGAAHLIRNFKIGKIIQGKGITEDYTIDDAIIDRQVSRDFVMAGDIIPIDKHSAFYVLTPNFGDGLMPLTFVFKTGHVSFLFAEGLDKEEEKILVTRYGNILNSGVMKIPAHGSSQSLSAELLIKSSPLVSILQAGTFNRFDLPSDEVITKLYAAGNVIRRTDREGAIIFYTDGEKIWFDKWK